MNTSEQDRTANRIRKTKSRNKNIIEDVHVCTKHIQVDFHLLSKKHTKGDTG